MTRRAHADDGMTLIELMVTISIMGVAFATILAGLSGMFRSNTQTRQLAVAETYIRRYADDLQAATYVPCASAAAYQSSFSATVPTGYTAQVASVKYWNGDASSPSFGTTCATDQGVQQVTLTVATTVTTGGVSQSLVIVKRDPT
jgi:prepilin-type N-terminal cleavage/methylation domain-containing protein